MSGLPADLPDLTEGVDAAGLHEGALLDGRVGEERVLLTRSQGELFAVGGSCTHYHAALAGGVVVDGTVRCPWHHARFCLRTGEAVAAPAIDPLSRWAVWTRDGRIGVEPKPLPRAAKPSLSAAAKAAAPRRVVIVGGGAAGFACAERLRRDGFDGVLSLVTAEEDAPYDRPNCSKDFLAGQAPAEWMPLREAGWYADHGIGLWRSTTVGAIDVLNGFVTLRNGDSLGYDALVLATGAEPRRIDAPGLETAPAFTLRTRTDAEAIIAASAKARRAVVVGASFIGLEAAAALRTRGLEVAIVGLERVPLERVLGVELGAHLQRLHEAQGVVFHLGRTVKGFQDGRLILDSDEALGADLVVVGVGVTPRTALAEAAGLSVDDGILVDSRLRASAPGVYAVGDIARFPWRSEPRGARVEHWAHAQRQGQHVARTILGDDEPFAATPFFWSAHDAETVRYVGYAAGFSEARVEGDFARGDAEVQYLKGGEVKAVATLGRDRSALAAEAAFDATATVTLVS